MADTDEDWIDVSNLPPGATIPSRTGRDWSPRRALARGALICLIPGSILAAGMCFAAAKVPEMAVCHAHDNVQVAVIIGMGNALVGFVAAWILYFVMHRASAMVGLGCTLVVVAFVVLMLIAKQAVVAKVGVSLPNKTVIGWEWLRPVRFFTSNIGAWIGIAGAVHLFREGDSITELFGSTLS